MTGSREISPSFTPGDGLEDVGLTFMPGSAGGAVGGDEAEVAAAHGGDLSIDCARASSVQRLGDGSFFSSAMTSAASSRFCVTISQSAWRSGEWNLVEFLS